MKTSKAWSVMILAATIGLLPMLMSPSTIDAVLVPRFTILAIAVLVTAIALFFEKSQVRPAGAFLSSKRAWPFYLFFITAFAASLVAVNKAEAYFSIGRDLLFFLFMLLLMQALTDSTDRLKTLLKGLVTAAMIFTGFGIVQLVQVSVAAEGEVGLYLVRSTMAHRNLLVSASVLMFPLMVYAVYALKNFWRGLAFFTALFALTLIVQLEARAGWVAFSVMTFFYFGAHFVSNTRLRKFRLPLVTISIAIIVFSLGSFLVFYTATPETEANAELRQGMGFTQQDDKTFTIDERIFMWKATGRMVNDQSLGGVGPGNWKILFPKYGSDIWRARQGMTQFQRPHNDYLWILAEQGIIGLLAYFFIGFSIFYCGWRVFLKSEDSEKRHAALVMLTVIVGYSIFSFFSFPRERIFHQLVIHFAFAVILSFYFTEGAREQLKRSILLPILAVLLLPILIFMGYQRWVGEARTAKMLIARSSANWEAVPKEYKTMEGFKFYNLDPTSVPPAFYSGLAHLNLGDLPEAKEDFLEAYLAHPYNIHVVNNLANVYQLRGELEEAIVYYERALEISPKYMEGALNLISVYFNNNELGQAYEKLRKYNGLFKVEGSDDQRYQQYLLVVLRTMRDNLADEQADELTRKALKNLDDQKLLELHSTLLEENASIQKEMLKAANQYVDLKAL